MHLALLPYLAYGFSYPILIRCALGAMVTHLLTSNKLTLFSRDCPSILPVGPFGLGYFLGKGKDPIKLAYKKTKSRSFRLRLFLLKTKYSI